MRALYIEDLASHGGPEPCVGDLRGRSEALDRGACRRAMEPRNQLVRGADAVGPGGRQHHRSRYREWPVDPARSENLACTRALHAENREIPRPPVRVMAGWAAQGTPRR
jgi:hypothetical protein